MKRVYNKFIYFIIALFISLPLSAASVHIKVENASGGNAIGVGDLIYVQYTLKDCYDDLSAPSSIPGAKVLYFTLANQRTQIVIEGNKEKHSREAVYTLTARAEKAGSYSYGPVVVGNLKSNKVSYTISPTSVASAGNSKARTTDDQKDSQKPVFIGRGDNNLFLKAEVSKSTAYEQEALVYTLKLYTTYDNVKFIGATSAPKFEGFVIEESKAVSNQFSTESIGGKTYATAVIARYIIFPQMPGQLKVLGNTYTISVDRREYYHDPFWGRMSVSQPLQLNAKPNDLVVNVKALPSPKPADFSGGVGNFTISSQLATGNLLTNQPASLVYTVTGIGNLKYIKLPDLSMIFPRQLEVSSPTSTVTADVGASNVTGKMKFDYSLTPLEEGKYTIPEIKLVFFNPAKGVYETAVAKGYNIEVGKGKASDKSQRKSKLTFDSKLMPVTQSVGLKSSANIYSPLYWLFCYLLPVCVLICTLFMYRRHIRLNSDLIAVKNRKAAQVARKQLKKAQKCIEDGKNKEFYDVLLSALWGYAGDKLKMPTSELTRENIKEKMISDGISQDNANNFTTLIDECEFIKYAPDSDGSNVETLYNKADKLIQDIEMNYKIENAKKSKQEKTHGRNNVMIVLILLISLFAGSFCYASDIESADKAYTEGNYDVAIQQYRRQLQQYGASAAVLFNLGNAYYQNHEYGQSMLCYSRAYKLDPYSKEIKNNLNFLSNKIIDQNKAQQIEERINVNPDEKTFFENISDIITVQNSSDYWSVFAAVSFILCLIFAAVYIFSSKVLLRKLGFFSGLIFLFFSVCFLSFTFFAAANYNRDDKGIIMTDKSMLYKDEQHNSTTSKTPLSAGTAVDIVEKQVGADGKDIQYKVRLNSEYEGWIDANNVEII